MRRCLEVTSDVWYIGINLPELFILLYNCLSKKIMINLNVWTIEIFDWLHHKLSILQKRKGEKKIKGNIL